MRVDVVVNARAAKFQKDPQLVAQVGTICRGKAAVHASSSLEQLQDIAHQLAQASPGWIILCGGDGSYMAGVTSLIRAYGTRPLPLLSFASGGNTCTIARNWGRLVHDPVEHVRALLSTFPHEASRSATARPSLSVNDDHASRVGFIFGTGMVSSFFKAF